MLDEREFELVNILGSGEGINQRTLAEKMGLSLGMVNMLIRRLATKGLLRVKQLNKQKVGYLLTPKGFSEKMRKSVRYTMKTLDSLSVIRNRLKSVVESLNKSESNNFLVIGNNDLIDLLEMAFKNYYQGQYMFKRCATLPIPVNGEIILACGGDDNTLVWPEGTVFIVRELVNEPVMG